MKGRFGAVLAGCLLAMVLGSTTARAAEGRIEFSGAVLAPTCAASVARIDALLAHQDDGSAQIACQGAGASAPTTYSLTVSSIDTKSAGNNQLLTYFLGYAHAAGKAGTQPALVTQVFS
jgi:type 1 fimbria pilin